VHSRLDQALPVSLIYDTPGRKQGLIVNVHHFLGSGCTMFDIFVEPLL